MSKQNKLCITEKNQFIKNIITFCKLQKLIFKLRILKSSLDYYNDTQYCIKNSNYVYFYDTSQNINKNIIKGIIAFENSNHDYIKSFYEKIPDYFIIYKDSYIYGFYSMTSKNILFKKLITDNLGICGICYSSTTSYIMHFTCKKCGFSYCRNCLDLMDPKKCPQCRTIIKFIK